jgi:hypothetical protein
MWRRIAIPVTIQRPSPSPQNRYTAVTVTIQDKHPLSWTNKGGPANVCTTPDRGTRKENTVATTLEEQFDEQMVNVYQNAMAKAHLKLPVPAVLGNSACANRG